MLVGIGDLCCEGAPVLLRRLVDAGPAGGKGGFIARPHGVLVRGVDRQHALVGAPRGDAVLAGDPAEPAGRDQHQADARRKAELERLGDLVIGEWAEGLEPEPVAIKGERAATVGVARLIV